MKKMTFSAVAVVLLGFVGYSGGNVVPPPMQPPVVQDDWSGAYAGVQVGAVLGKGDVSIPEYPSNFTLKPNGFAGGLFAGYNWLKEGNFLLGVEADINGISADKSHLSGYSDRRGKETYKLKEYWDASLRVRFGKVIDDKYLPYITTGVAWTKLGASYKIGNDVSETKKKTVAGFTIGTGIEMKLTNKVNARIQYRYSNYSKANFMHAGPSSVKYKSHMIQAGFSYKFN